jgi:hypothetical protein
VEQLERQVPAPLLPHGSPLSPWPPPQAAAKRTIETASKNVFIWTVASEELPPAT